MYLDAQVIVVSMAAVMVIGFMKGAFGGGFAIIGIPLLALVMDPIEADSLLAPLFVAMDLYALRYWRPHTWSRPDLHFLVPGLLLGADGDLHARVHPWCLDRVETARTPGPAAAGPNLLRPAGRHGPEAAVGRMCRVDGPDLRTQAPATGPRAAG
jgi:hypothetical protein